MDVAPYESAPVGAHGVGEGAHGVGAHGHAPLQLLLEVYRMRVRRERRLRYFALAGIALGALWLVGALLSFKDAAFPGMAFVLLGGTVLLPALALGLEHVQRPSITQTAEMLDKRLDDRERLITSVELLSREQPLRVMAQTQLSTSTELLASKDAEELYPARTPWPAFSLGGGLLLVALGLFLLKGVLNGFTPLQVGGLPPDQQNLAAVVSPTPQSGLPESGATPPTSSLPSANSNNSSDATRSTDASQQAQNGLQRLTKALDEQSATQQAADSLRQGDYGGAAQKLTDLGQQSDQLSDAAKQGLGDSLGRSAQDSASTPDLQQAEQQAADALKNGDYNSIARSLKSLGDAVQKTAGDIIPQQELAKRFPEQSNNSQGSALQEGQSQGQSQDAQQGQDSQQGGQQDQSGQSSQNGQQGQQGQGQKGQQNGQGSTSSAQANSQNQNTGSNTGGEGHNSRVMGPADNTRLNVGNNPFELQGQPKPGNTKPGDPNQQPALTLEGNSGSGDAMAPSQGGPSSAQSESNHPPVSRWRVIQRYFGGGQ